MRKLACVLLATTALTAPARAEPISTAIGLTLAVETVIGGTAIAGISAGAIGGAIVSGALGIGVSLLSGVLAKPTTADGADATPSGVQSSLRIGADIPRNRVFGKQMLAGQLAYWNLYGPDNRWLQLVFVLGTGPHDLFGVFGDGNRLTLGAMVDDTGYPITDYNFGGQVVGWVRFYSGLPDQAADPQLVDFAVPAGRWTSADTGTGVCYARVTLFYWSEVYQNGIPSFQFEVGARCYDPRKDSTSGGSGAHLWSDQHTWEWTDNPAVVLYNYERGLYVNSQRVIGRGLAPVDMVRGMYVDAANVCDETVTLKGGGSEQRYRVGINVGADRDLKSVEQDLMIAMAGSLIEVAGAWGPLAGTAKEIVATITDDDFVTGRLIRYSQKKPRDQLVNALFGAFSDPVQNYQEVPYAPRTSSADEAEDGDRFQVRRDYPQVQSQTQAQRIGEIERRDARYQASAGGTLPFKFSYVEAGDWVQWISARRNFDKVFRVKSHRLAADQTIELAIDETSADVFDFDPTADELDPLNPGDLPGIGGLISMVPDFGVGTLQLDGQGALTIPALVAVWSPITDRTVDSVIVQYRIGLDDSTAKVAQPFPPGDGEGIITDGVQAGTSYQARAVLTSTPARPMYWTAWVPVISAPNHVVPSALTSTPIDAITLAMFEAGLKDFVGKQLSASLAEVNRIEQLVASVAAEQESANWFDQQNYKIADVRITGQVSALSGGKTWRGDYSATALYHANDMVKVAGRLYSTPSTVQGVLPPAAPWVEEYTVAFISEEWRTFAGPDGVAAQTSDSIETRFGGGTLEQSLAQIVTSWKAFAGPDFAVAQSETTTLAQVSGNTASISTNSTAIAGITGKLAATWQVTLDVNGYVSGLKAYNDGSTTNFTIITDSFLVAKPGVGGGAVVPVFAISNVGGVAKIVVRGDMLADGTITTSKINAGAVTAVTVGANTIITNAANIQTLIVDNIHIRGAAVTVPSYTQLGGSAIIDVNPRVQLSAPVTFQGVAGSTVYVEAHATGIIHPNGASCVWGLAINNVTVAQQSSNELTNNYGINAAGAVAVTATGGVQTVSVEFRLISTGISSLETPANLFGCSYLR